VPNERSRGNPYRSTWLRAAQPTEILEDGGALTEGAPVPVNCSTVRASMCRLANAHPHSLAGTSRVWTAPRCNVGRYTPHRHTSARPPEATVFVRIAAASVDNSVLPRWVVVESTVPFGLPAGLPFFQKATRLPSAGAPRDLELCYAHGTDRWAPRAGGRVVQWSTRSPLRGAAFRSPNTAAGREARVDRLGSSAAPRPPAPAGPPPRSGREFRSGRGFREGCGTPRTTRHRNRRRFDGDRPPLAVRDGPSRMRD
jgi:hypothetical protein